MRRLGARGLTSPSPAVTVCLPVFNGEHYLREAISSVLAQTFQDLELIVSDNASTDGTPDICQEVSRLDARVRYVRLDRNRGLAFNFNHAFRLARGRYVAWIGHDDVMDPGYIERCVRELEQNVDAVLCFANGRYIDESGGLVDVDLRNPGMADRPSERFLGCIFGPCDPIFGLMRRTVLTRTRLHAPYPDSDRTLLVEVAFHGRFARVPERLFHRRMHPLRTTLLHQDHWDRALVFDPGSAGMVCGPWIRQLIDLTGVIWRAPIGPREQARCVKYLYWWAAHHRRCLVSDVRRGFDAALRRLGRVGRPRLSDSGL